MIRTTMTAVALMAASALLSTPAMAQVQIAVLDGDAADAYRAAGVVSAEVTPSAAGATLPKQALDDRLRAEAAKLGADAVILTTYQLASPATPNVAHRATGVAIRYTQRTATPAPVIVPPAPSPAIATAPAAPAPVVVMHALAADQVILTESDLPNRRYIRIGPVSTTVHQKAMVTKVPEMQQLQDAMRASAFAMGADAVINVKYKMTNGMFSKEGDTGTGTAVRFE
ncbi:MAG: hypothetical protein QM773_04150 [Hyphomonadaceae bacterium]